MATIEESVKSTAAFLDRHVVGWAEKMDLAELAKSARFKANDKEYPEYHAAWLAERALRLGTPAAEEARVEAQPMATWESPL